MTKRKRKAKARRVKDHDGACNDCGETDHKLHRLAVVCDGKVTASWRLCRACMAGRTVGLSVPPKR